MRGQVDIKLDAVVSALDDILKRQRDNCRSIRSLDVQIGGILLGVVIVVSILVIAHLSP